MFLKNWMSWFALYNPNQKVLEIIMSQITVAVAPGELIDKITILEIKSERIQDPEKLKNINFELSLLVKTWKESEYAATDISTEQAALKSINEKLWQIEDDIRIKESKGQFDSEFIELARSVYISNDERARIKRVINTMLGSNLVEEKSYADYGRK